MAVRQQWVVAFAQAQMKYPAELSPASSEEELEVVLSAGSSNINLGDFSHTNPSNAGAAATLSVLSLGQASLRSARSSDVCSQRILDEPFFAFFPSYLPFFFPFWTCEVSEDGCAVASWLSFAVVYRFFLVMKFGGKT